MAVEVTFFGGVGDYKNGELGGVQGLFNDPEKKTKFLLECGQRPDHTNQYYGFPYRPKSFNFLGLSDFLELFPGLSEIYREDYERHRGRTLGPLPLEGILITHPHYDHAGGLSLVRDDMPVHMSQIAKQILWLWQYTSGRTVNQFIDLFDQFSVVNNTLGDPKFLYGDEAVIGRDIRLFEPEKSFKIGNIKITPYPVDHSTPGSYGFIMETSAGKIGITGDIRQRGLHPENTERFIQALEKQDISYLFCEGSLLHFDHEGDENDVTQEMKNLLKGKAFAGVAYPPRDFDRITSMYKAAKATDRMLVVPPAQALGLQLLDGINGYPKLNWKYIGVLLSRKRKGLIDRPEFSKEMVEKDYYMYERKFLKLKRWAGHQGKPQRVSLEDIKDNQDKFLVFLSSNLMPELLMEVQPAPNSIYVRSHPAPWTLDMELGEAHDINVRRAFKLYDGEHADVLTPVDNGKPNTKKMWQVHVTGHMNRDEKRAFIERVVSANPDVTIVPYHSMYPRDFPEDVAKSAKKVIVPRRGKTFILK